MKAEPTRRKAPTSELHGLYPCVSGPASLAGCCLEPPLSLRVGARCVRAAHSHLLRCVRAQKWRIRCSGTARPSTSRATAQWGKAISRLCPSTIGTRTQVRALCEPTRVRITTPDRRNRGRAAAKQETRYAANTRSRRAPREERQVLVAAIMDRHSSFLSVP